MSDPIYVELLGPVRVQGTGQPPADRAHSLRELVAWLACHPEGAYGHQIDRDLVWSPDSRIAGLSRARRWLGRTALPIAHGVPYRLCAGTDWDQARALVTDRTGRLDPTTATADLLAALKLVRGVPLADIGAPWADGFRLQAVLLLREVAVEALTRPEVTGTVALGVRATAALLLPSDRVDAAGLLVA